jgi:quinolinate synthase
MNDSIDLQLNNDFYIKEINKLREEKNAIILAHFYQAPEIQDLADFVGDSLGLSINAAQTKADIILFSGVHFMAETAKIISPNKKVLLPDINAGCSLADSCPPEEFKDFVRRYPEHIIISYVNSSASVKAMSDIICTSANAVTIVNSLPRDAKIIFAPDKNLGRYVEQQTGRKLVLWDGTCEVHENFSGERLEHLLATKPSAKFIAHPECREAVLALADMIGSTSALLKFINEDEAMEYIVGTEPGIIHQMQLQQPNKTFVEAPVHKSCNCNECPYMRLNTLEKIYFSLKNETPEVILDEDILLKAKVPIERMLKHGRSEPMGMFKPSVW